MGVLGSLMVELGAGSLFEGDAELDARCECGGDNPEWGWGAGEALAFCAFDCCASNSCSLSFAEHKQSDTC